MASTGLGITVGSHSLRAVVVRKKGESYAITKVVSMPMEGGDAATAGRRLAAEGIRGHPATLGLSGSDVIIRYNQVPPVPDWRLRNLMKFEVLEVSGQSGGEVSADWRKMNLPDPEGTRGEDTVLVCLARNAYLKPLMAGVEGAGIKVARAAARRRWACSARSPSTRRTARTRRACSSTSAQPGPRPRHPARGRAPVRPQREPGRPGLHRRAGERLLLRPREGGDAEAHEGRRDAARAGAVRRPHGREGRQRDGRDGGPGRAADPVHADDRPRADEAARPEGGPGPARGRRGLAQGPRRLPEAVDGGARRAVQPVRGVRPVRPARRREAGARGGAARVRLGARPRADAA